MQTPQSISVHTLTLQIKYSQPVVTFLSFWKPLITENNKVRCHWRRVVLYCSNNQHNTEKHCPTGISNLHNSTNSVVYKKNPTFIARCLPKMSMFLSPLKSCARNAGRKRYCQKWVNSDGRLGGKIFCGVQKVKYSSLCKLLHESNKTMCKEIQITIF